MSFIPSRGEFVAEAEREREPRAQSNHVFGIKRGKQRAPVHLRGSRIEKKRRDSSLEEGLETREGSLSELAEGEGLIGLEALEPGAEAKLMASACQADPVFIGEQIPRDS